MPDMMKVMGLWKNKSKEGKEYFAGYLGALKVLIFTNDKKESEKDFDYNVFVAPAPKKTTE